MMTNETGVPDLYRLAFMPGCFRCPRCDYQLTKSCLNPQTGQVGTREQERESEPCPNDGTMMVHVTYREQLEVYAERLKEEFERFETHAREVGRFLSELYQIMVDPLDEGVRTVQETMDALRLAALRDREVGNMR